MGALERGFTVCVLCFPQKAAFTHWLMIMTVGESYIMWYSMRSVPYLFLFSTGTIKVRSAWTHELCFEKLAFGLRSRAPTCKLCSDLVILRRETCKNGKKNLSEVSKETIIDVQDDE